MLIGRSFNSTFDRVLTLNRVLDAALASSWNGAASRFWVPAMDVVERDDAYLISVELPGVDPDLIDIGFEQNVLTLKGSKAPAIAGESPNNAELRVHSSERLMGSFERSVRLPEFVDGDGIAAEFTNGVLFLTIPKAKAAQPKKIRVNGVERKQVEQ